ncbi:cysteine-rich repeat protein [Corallococcus coralloides]|uniref:Cysteine-rich repeat protein n=1 Tax=Corallococcus coralloides TaxID=184914 RepID=A0A410S2N2_CORCK|nr:hypothetical protein [Corallococcus coralloides]QAT88402.1 cysteine-rich repeat protein [Corallococcus coralloides]
MVNVNGPDRPEACDDGNTKTEVACDYGQASCQKCSGDCQSVLPLQGNVCGDNLKDATNEACDDGNTLICGSCSANCKAKTLTAATGSITASSGFQMYDEETFTISDGINTPVTFEVDRDNKLKNNAHQRVVLASDTPAAQVAQAIRNAINAVEEPFEIEAAISASSTITVNLTHKLQGSIGNQTITERITNMGFRVSGMTGGSGYDCAQGTKCVGDEDCARDLVCGTNKTCAPPPVVPAP